MLHILLETADLVAIAISIFKLDAGQKMFDYLIVFFNDFLQWCSIES